MSKRPSLSASFEVGKQPILEHGGARPQPIHIPTPKPTPARRDHRANMQAFTVWLDRDLVERLRTCSRELVYEHGRQGNSIEALVTEAIEGVLAKRRQQE